TVDRPATASIRRKLQPVAGTSAPDPTDVPEKKYADIDDRLSIPDELLRENLVFCTSEFNGVDTSRLRKQFPLKITSPRPRRQLFTSFGFMVNEYSGGAEIRIGIPSLYAVANAGLMREGYLRYGYGIGSTIPIKSGISITPVYTFATLRRRQDFLIDENLNLVVDDGLKLKGKHHQLKFLFQIQLSRRLTLHAGPTINLLKSSFIYDKNPVVLTQVIRSYAPSPNSYYPSPSSVSIARSVYYLPPPDYSTFKSWVGFEGGLSYAIKFSRR
ncbi:MAG TPA: hypothetical protein VFZ52_07075, partial [Chryseolinea sp.]